jgi:hypothetical protein
MRWLIPVVVRAGITTGLVVAWRRSRRDSPPGDRSNPADRGDVAEGKRTPGHPDDYRDVFGNRWNNLLQRILQSRSEEEKKMKLGLVWQVLGRTEGG